MFSKSFTLQIKFHHLDSIDSDKILYCKANGSYTEIYFNNQKKAIISKRLNIVETLLNNPNLIRCHKSFLVNTFGICTFSNTKPYLLVLRNDQKIPVSYRKRKDILEKLIKQSLN